MSDWNRGGRDDDQRRFGGSDRERREFEDNNRQAVGRNERRSFGDTDHDDYRRREDQDWRPRLGGSAGRPPQDDDHHRYDPGKFATQSFAGPEFGLTNYEQAFGGPEYGESEYGRDYNAGNDLEYIRERRERAMRNQGGQDWRRGAEQPARPNMGGQAMGTQYGRDPNWDRQGGGGAMFGNDPLRRVTDGETDHALRDNMGAHRGRGPKNYSRSDDRIREDVNDRLTDDSWLDASEIDVHVASGEVTLTGTVTSRDDKRRAEDLAEHVSGVRHVQNNLRVGPQGGAQTPTPTAQGS